MSDSSDGARLSDSPLIGRRTFLWGSAVAAALPIITEGGLAQARLSGAVGVPPPDAVIINANENPLGPCKAACEAIVKIAPHGGRYDRMGEQDKFVNDLRRAARPEAGERRRLRRLVRAAALHRAGLHLADQEPGDRRPVLRVADDGRRTSIGRADQQGPADLRPTPTTSRRWSRPTRTPA